MRTDSQTSTPNTTTIFCVILLIVFLLQLAVNITFANVLNDWHHRPKNSKQKAVYGPNLRYSQPIFAISTGALISTSQHGDREYVNFSVETKNITFEIGTFAGYDKHAVSGINSRFTWNIVGQDNFNLFLFGSLIYHDKAILSKSAQSVLYRGISDYDKPVFTTVEEYVGFGLSYSYSKLLSFNSNIGLGSYQSKVNNGVTLPVDDSGVRDNIGWGLIIQIGVKIRI